VAHVRFGTAAWAGSRIAERLCYIPAFRNTQADPHWYRLDDSCSRPVLRIRYLDVMAPDSSLAVCPSPSSGNSGPFSRIKRYEAAANPRAFVWHSGSNLSETEKQIPHTSMSGVEKKTRKHSKAPRSLFVPSLRLFASQSLLSQAAVQESTTEIMPSRAP
jgi:hypothetical protein